MHTRQRTLARPAALMGILAVVALVVLSCSKSGETGKEGPQATAPAPNKMGGVVGGPPDDTNVRDGGRLVFALEAEPEGLDPTRYAFSSSGHFVASAVFDPLAKMDTNGRPEPYLAKSFTPSDGNKTWTIAIREGIKFHDDEPLTAEVVAKNIDAHRKSMITQLSFQIVDSATVTNPTTVEVKLNRSMTDFPGMLTTQLGYIISPKMLESTDLVNKPIGTGPFVFQSHEKDKSWTFNKNASYWQQGKPHLEGIDFLPMPDNAERLAKLRSGDLDIMYNVRVQQTIELRNSGFKRVENGDGEENYLLLNTQAPPFEDLTARKAVAHAADTARWRKELELDVEQPANSPFTKGQVGYLEDNGYPKFDLAKAKELVQQYEREKGKPLGFSWYTQDDVYSQQEAQFFAKNFEDAGMKVTVKTFPQINLIAQVVTGSYEMSRFRLFSQSNPDIDATTFWRSTSVLPSGVSLNMPRYVNDKIDQAIDTAMASTDRDTRDKAYQTVNRELAANVPYLWMGRPVWVLAANPRVNGIGAAANGSIQTVGEKTWLVDLWLSSR